MTSYTFDANILINMERWYPREHFASVWSNVEELITDGRACICGMVEEEIKRGTDDLHKWTRSIDEFVHPHTEQDYEIAAKISTAHPDWVVEKQNAADPFVIAHAAIEGSILVTQETRKGPGAQGRNLKIPNVADEHGVTCINFFGLLKAENWRF